MQEVNSNRFLPPPHLPDGFWQEWIFDFYQNDQEGNNETNKKSEQEIVDNGVLSQSFTNKSKLTQLFYAHHLTISIQ